MHAAGDLLCVKTPVSVRRWSEAEAVSCSGNERKDMVSDLPVPTAILTVKYRLLLCFAIVLWGLKFL